MSTEPTDMPIACGLSSTAHAARLDELRTTLFAACVAVEETADGYAFAFPDEVAPRILGFIGFERGCCPFLTFELHLPPAGEQLYLELSGDDEIKAFIAATFLTLVPMEDV